MAKTSMIDERGWAKAIKSKGFCECLQLLTLGKDTDSSCGPAGHRGVNAYTSRASQCRIN